VGYIVGIVIATLTTTKKDCSEAAFLTLPRPLELLRQRPVSLRRVLDRPAHARVLHLLRALTLLIRHRPASLRGRGEFGVCEIERHVHIVAPPGARVHAVPAGAGDWMASRTPGSSTVGCNRPRDYTHGVRDYFWLDLALWLALGAFVGFRRGRTAFGRRFFAATSTAEGLEAFPRSGNLGKARLRGYRLGMSLMFALGGAVIAGLIFGGLQLLRHWLG
jgi:hypothetical protein